MMQKYFKVNFGLDDEGETELSILNKYKLSKEIFEKYLLNKGGEIIDEKMSNIYEEMVKKRLPNFERGFHHRITLENSFFDARFESFKFDKNDYGSLRLSLKGPQKIVYPIGKIMGGKVEKIDPKFIDSLIGQ